MKMMPLSDVELPAGRVVEWRVRPSAELDTGSSFEATKLPSATQKLYFEQMAQLAPGHEGRLSIWIGATLEIAGPVDTDALREAFHYFLRRHEVLRAEFRTHDDDLYCDVLAPDSVVFDQTELGTFDDPEAVRRALTDRVDGTLDTNAGPLLLMGVVIGEQTSVAYVAFDHLLSDGYSCAVTAHELGSIYDAIRTDAPVELPAVGSYLDFGATEREYCEQLTADDPRLELWRGFVERNGHVFTEFPVDMQAEPGRWYPATVDLVRILDEKESESFEERCRELGASQFGGVLAATGIALHEMRGIDVFRTVMPIAARKSAEWQNALGWFVNLLPLEFKVAGVEMFPEVLEAARTAFRTALDAADLPLAGLFTHLGEEYLPMTGRPLGPQSHISFIDYRKLAGADQARWRRPVTLMRVTNTCDARTWYFRTLDGTYLLTNFIDTAPARQVRDEYQNAVRQVMTHLISPQRLELHH
jgi:hypothetical protein